MIKEILISEYLENICVKTKLHIYHNGLEATKIVYGTQQSLN